MERQRGARDSFFDVKEPFGGTRGFGSFGLTSDMIPSLFEGRDPFDDPFFTRPFGSMFRSSTFGPSVGPAVAQETNAMKGMVIEELGSDDEGEENEAEGCRDEVQEEPSIEHPDDIADAERKSKSLNSSMDYSRVQGTQNQTHRLGVQSCRVTYGGVDGAYYTSTRTRKSGGNGVVFEESKEADITAGEATHRISRGIHDKGHSVTRKLNSDGKVDTLQALHNLNEDELAGFDEAWSGNIKGHMPGWGGGVHDMHGCAGPASHEQVSKSGWGDMSLATSKHARGARFGTYNDRGDSSSGRTKKVVRINIE